MRDVHVHFLHGLGGGYTPELNEKFDQGNLDKLPLLGVMTKVYIERI